MANRFSVETSEKDAASLYVHLPFCRSRCGYCDFVTAATPDIPFGAYTEALLAEYTRMRPWFPDSGFHTVYVGGGTPSLWSAPDLIRVLDGVGVKPDVGAEVTVEVNPRDGDEEWFRRLLHAGVNRFSIGVQATTDSRLRWLGRTHSVDDSRRTLDSARAAGCSNISVDFIYGTPDQTVSDVQAELDALLGLRPEHVSAYELSLSPGCALGRSAHPPTLPDSDHLAVLWHEVRSTLQARGYSGYEVSNYSLSTFESRHNRHYWRGGRYLALGAGAHGHVQNGAGRFRYGNTPDVAEYLSHAARKTESPGTMATVDVVPDVALARELIMLGLRTEAGFALDDLAALAPMEQPAWHRVFEDWQQRGLVVIQDNQILPLPDAMLLADELAVACF